MLRPPAGLLQQLRPMEPRYLSRVLSDQSLVLHRWCQSSLFPQIIVRVYCDVEVTLAPE